MNDLIKYTRKAACNILAQAHPGFDRQAESDQFSNGGFRPAEFAGQVLYGVNELVALDYQLTLRREGWPVKLAGALATRLHEALGRFSDTWVISLVTLENGNRFATGQRLDTRDDQIQHGAHSGHFLREVLVIHAHGLRKRIRRLIEEAAQIVGEPDDAD